MLRGGLVDPTEDKEPVHEAIREYLRWQNRLPSWYASVGDMPALVALGFDYLVRQYPRQDNSLMNSVHAAALDMERRRVDME